MKYEYKKNLKSGYHYLDSFASLGAYGAFNINQDHLTEYFDTMHCGNITMMKECNSIWVITKAKYHFDSPSVLDETYSVDAGLDKLGYINAIYNCECYGQDGKKRFHFITEMVPVDFEKRKIKRISDVCFPKDAEVNGASDLEFSNLKVGI
nr:hypothetical protein [Bacilli bacterium]